MRTACSTLLFWTCLLSAPLAALAQATGAADAGTASATGSATTDSTTSGSATAGAPDSPATASASPDGGAAPRGVLTRPPELLRHVEARFPEELADAGVGGTVLMELDIGADGRVMDARVTGSAGPAFDAAALEAVRQFEFRPAEVDHQPAAVRVEYRYEFLYRPQVVETAPPANEPQVNFTGRLVERGTRTPVANATVVLTTPDGPREALSDEDGRFALADIPAGEWPILVSSTDHERFEDKERIAFQERTEVTYHLRRKVYGAYESVVRGVRERKEVAQVALKQEEIRLIPGTGGDAFKVVQNLPGVSRAPFSVGLLVVRGGKPWDTRVYVDDALVPLLFHFGGLNATFNANLLEDITFLPGNYGVDYGRSIGGLVRGEVRTPSKEGTHGYVDVNLIESSFLVEAPLTDRWSFAVSARRSYIDLLLPVAIDVLAPESEDTLVFTVAPRYYDYQARLEHRRPGSADRFSVTLFGSHDQLALLFPNPAFDPEGRGDVTTLLTYHRLTVNWEKRLASDLRLRSSTFVGWDHSQFSLGADLFFDSDAYPFQTRQALIWELPEQKLELSFGLDVLGAPFRYVAQGPPPFKSNQIPDPFLSRQLISDEDSKFALEPGLFVDAVWKPLPGLKLVPGIRFDYESVMDDTWVDPRVNAFYELFPGTTLKAGWGKFHQPPDYRQGLLTEKFGNPELLPEAAVHHSLGFEQRFTDAISLDVQGYYTDLYQQAQPTQGQTLDGSGDSDAEEVPPPYRSTGVGRSYGVEVLLRHALTRSFFGWISYSFSRSQRKYSGETEYLPHPLDQPHNLVLVASYKLPRDWIAGVRLRWATGALDTPVQGAVYDVNGNYHFPLLGQFFTRRLPAFFQADVRIDKRFVFDSWMLSLYADVQNVTNRQNVEGVVNNFDFTDERYLNGLPILPSLGIRGEW